MWSHLSPLKCAEVTNGCSGHQQRKYGRLIQQNQLKRKTSEEACLLCVEWVRCHRLSLFSLAIGLFHASISSWISFPFPLHSSHFVSNPKHSGHLTNGPNSLFHESTRALIIILFKLSITPPAVVLLAEASSGSLHNHPQAGTHSRSHYLA